MICLRGGSCLAAAVAVCVALAALLVLPALGRPDAVSSASYPQAGTQAQRHPAAPVPARRPPPNYAPPADALHPAARRRLTSLKQLQPTATTTTTTTTTSGGGGTISWWLGGQPLVQNPSSGLWSTIRTGGTGGGVGTQTFPLPRTIGSGGSRSWGQFFLPGGWGDSPTGWRGCIDFWKDKWPHYRPDWEWEHPWRDGGGGGIGDFWGRSRGLGEVGGNDGGGDDDADN